MAKTPRQYLGPRKYIAYLRDEEEGEIRKNENKNRINEPSVGSGIVMTEDFKQQIERRLQAICDVFGKYVNHRGRISYIQSVQDATDDAPADICKILHKGR